jgi:hypothetical protein
LLCLLYRCYTNVPQLLSVHPLSLAGAARQRRLETAARYVLAPSFRAFLRVRVSVANERVAPQTETQDPPKDTTHASRHLYVHFAELPECTPLYISVNLLLKDLWCDLRQDNDMRAG